MNPATPAVAPPIAPIPPEHLAVIERTVAAALAPIQKLYESIATNNAPPVGQAPVERSPITGREVADGTGLTFIRTHMIQASLALKGMGPGSELFLKEGARLAKDFGYGRVAKIFSEGTLTSGGAFVQDRLMVEEWIELLRNRTVIRRAGARQLTMPGGGAVRMPRQTGSSTAYWVGETEPATLTEPTSDQVTWYKKKLMVLVGVSNDVIRAVGSERSEEFVRDDALKVYALEEDRAFLRGLGSDNTPRGIRYRVASANIVAETVASEGNPTLAEIDTELEGMMKDLENNNALTDMSRPVWFMSANPKYKLRAIRDSNGNAVYVTEMNTGKLKGYNFFSTQQIPQNLGGDGDESELYFVDMDGVVIMDFLNMEVMFFPNGTHVVGGSQVTGIGPDASVLRIVGETDINLRHDVGGSIRTELSWGY